MTDTIKKLRELGWKRNNYAFEFRNGNRYVEYGEERRFIDVYAYANGVKYGTYLTAEELLLFAEFIKEELK